MLLFGELRQVPPIYSPVSNQTCNKQNYFTYTSILIILTYANKYKSLICNNSVTTTVLQQQCHNSKFVIFQEKLLKVLKNYNFL